MDHQHHKNNRIPSPFTSSKKAIQILFSFSLFSFIFSQSSLLLPFPFPFPSFSIKLFNYSADRNYIFLLCNGILLVIIKNSGLLANDEFRDEHIHVHTDESKDLKNYDIVKKNDEPQVLSDTKSQSIQVVEAESEISSKEEEGDENVISSEAKDEDQLLLLGFEKEGDEFLDIKEKEEENEGGLLSAEELNKKCDDFIRKMKDGIKIEAQNLFMVSCQG